METIERIELYGTKGCPYTAELREDLLWQEREFREYDVEEEREALERMLRLTGGDRTVPVLVEGGRVTQVGWQGRACIVELTEREMGEHTMTERES